MSLLTLAPFVASAAVGVIATVLTQAAYKRLVVALAKLSATLKLVQNAIATEKARVEAEAKVVAAGIDPKGGAAS